MAEAESSGVRYSQGKKDMGAARDFSWEHPVPDNKFWNDLPFTVGRNFLQNFTPDQVEQLGLDPDSTLPKESKLELLANRLAQELDKRDSAAAPQTYYDVDYEGWDSLWLGIYTMQHELGDPKAESTLRMMCDKRKNKSNLSHQHTLAGLLLDKNKNSEAEEIEREVCAWLDSRLGKSSPQALSARRIIAEALWKQGSTRQSEATDMIRDIKDIVEQMGDGPFGVYKDEERKLVEELEHRLKA
ncbi:unnamed protein product [Clonostachys byssicola]|uniref:Uncharacterized protein n=1 Tax=Clonostachys byssicola TaxID=160290 RepID=A0A9N9UGL2_9HYPO|nr:unnamed protein product [Clonostachys byssicola]